MQIRHCAKCRRKSDFRRESASRRKICRQSAVKLGDCLYSDRGLLVEDFLEIRPLRVTGSAGRQCVGKDSLNMGV